VTRRLLPMTCASALPTAALTIATCLLSGITSCSGGTAGATYTKIDDMEGASGQIEWTPPVGDPGAWTSYTDTQCDRILPVPVYAGGTWKYEPVQVPYQTFPGITSATAARLRTTSPLINQFGAGIEFDFADLTQAPYDASTSAVTPACIPSYTHTLNTPAVTVDLTAYKGISFWGMASPGAGTGRVYLTLVDNQTDPRGRFCDPDTTSPLGCDSLSRFPIDLTSTFTQYTVDFSQLRRDLGWGYHATPDVLDLEKVYALEFGVENPGGACPTTSVCAGPPPSLTFDIWIDDLYFVNK
jgi:hypothetical protein